MTVKSATTNDYRIASCAVNDTQGGQYLQINFTDDMIELIRFWKEWGPVFNSKNPSVVDALKQARIIHEISK